VTNVERRWGSNHRFIVVSEYVTFERRRLMRNKTVRWIRALRGPYCFRHKLKKYVELNYEPRDKTWASANADLIQQLNLITSYAYHVKRCANRSRCRCMTCGLPPAQDIETEHLSGSTMILRHSAVVKNQTAVLLTWLIRFRCCLLGQCLLIMILWRFWPASS